ncbi:unnamed protein product [Lactuca saligna]|uniref:Gelsolin-like domain-containing protein n=1 Tax=Lactuca saligna TaxID=75948 RepID=A0AA35YED6_LACSI|nr:unnamed protein product [Lactuca saligna]
MEVNNGFDNRDGREVVFVSDKTGGSGSYPPTHLSSLPPSLTYAPPVRVQEVSMICLLALEAAVLHLVAGVYSQRKSAKANSLASAASALEETRGKVAALLKQQGAFAKGQTKTAPVEEEVPPLLGENGKIEVWRIDVEIAIFVFTPTILMKRKKITTCAARLGRIASRRTKNSCSTNYFNVQLYEMQTCSGSNASRKRSTTICCYLSAYGCSQEKGLHDETYSPDTAALIEISGTSVHNNKAQQVERSGVPVKFSREGKESLAFWLALGGKQSYSSSKVTQEIIREPHLFEVISNKGKLEIEEVHSFEQDDLFPEDVLILDTHAEVIVWVGHLAQSTEKQNDFETGEKYVELVASMDSLSPSVILYRVTEGNEPCFFTTYFSWDPTKTIAHGNAFHKKAVQLFGIGCVAESQDVKPLGNKLSEATQRASAMAALTSAFSKSTNAPKPPQHGPPPRMLARGS